MMWNGPIPMGKNKNIKQKKLSRQGTVVPTKTKIQAKQRKSGVASMHIIPGPWQTNAIIFVLLMVVTVAFYAGDLRLGFFAVDDDLALAPEHPGDAALLT